MNFYEVSKELEKLMQVSEFALRKDSGILYDFNNVNNNFNKLIDYYHNQFITFW